MEEKLYSLLVDQDEISWKSLLVELVHSEGMSPWDVDITKLTNRYIERLKDLKNADLKMSGKVVLAAAILLKIKSKRLVGEDLDEFDRLLASSEETSDEMYDSLAQELKQGELHNLPASAFELNPRVPQGRRRKVSIYELVSALEKALEVKQRRQNRLHISDIPMPQSKFDITTAITGLFNKILSFFGMVKEIKFSQLVENKTKEQKVYTFIPLLYLSNQRKIDLHQDEAFGEITIKQSSPDEVESSE